MEFLEKYKKVADKSIQLIYKLLNFHHSYCYPKQYMRRSIWHQPTTDLVTKPIIKPPTAPTTIMGA